MVLQKCRTMLVGIERILRNQGGSQIGARIGMARGLGIGMGTLENIIRVRVKTVSAELTIKIANLHMNTLEAEIARLSEDHKGTVEFLASLDPPQMDEVAALLEEARKRLRAIARRTP